MAGTTSGVEFRTIDCDTLKKSYYRGEGNTTLVLALPQEGTVLRLRKCDPTEESEAEREEDDSGEARVQRALNFHRKIIAPLLGSFVDEPEIVRCDSNDLRAHMCELEHQRSVSRRHKTVTETFATVLPDYCRMPSRFCKEFTVDEGMTENCIETKVKYLTRCYDNFKHDCDTLHVGSIDPVIQLTHFDTVPDPRSWCYCTLVGFNCLQEVLQQLPHEPKSLKFFEDGRLIKQAGASSERIFVQRWWLSNDACRGANQPCHLSGKDLFAAALTHPFPQMSSSAEKKWPYNETIVEAICRIQRNYYREVDEVYPIYAKYSSILTDRKVYEWDENAAANGWETSPGMPTFDELRILRDYLIYRVVRDASILVAYRWIIWREDRDIPGLAKVVSTGCKLPHACVFSVKLTDLEPKSVHCIEKHYRKKISK